MHGTCEAMGKKQTRLMLVESLLPVCPRWPVCFEDECNSVLWRVGVYTTILTGCIFLQWCCLSDSPLQWKMGERPTWDNKQRCMNKQASANLPRSLGGFFSISWVRYFDDHRLLVAKWVKRHCSLKSWWLSWPVWSATMKSRTILPRHWIRACGMNQTMTIQFDDIHVCKQISWMMP